MTSASIAIRLRRLVLCSCVACFGVAPILGCDTASERQAISGSVAVDGEPIVTGTILLLPDTGHRGPSASSSIIDGVYRFTTQNGPTAGPHRVVIGVSGSRIPANATSESETARSATSPESSSVAKQGPSSAELSTRATLETKPAELSPLKWETNVVVPASDSPDASEPINFAFQSNANVPQTETDTPP